MPWRYLRRLFVKGNTKSIRVFRMVDGSSSRDLVQYKCACQIWRNLMIHDADSHWILQNYSIGLRPKRTLPMDFYNG